MQSFLPVISSSGGISTTVLVNAERLTHKLGCDRLLKIGKTSVLVHPHDHWEFLLVDETQQITLLSSRDMSISEPTNIDLVNALGHQITLAPWQLLCLSGSTGRGPYVTYLIDE